MIKTIVSLFTIYGLCSAQNGNGNGQGPPVPITREPTAPPTPEPGQLPTPLPTLRALNPLRTTGRTYDCIDPLQCQGVAQQVMNPIQGFGMVCDGTDPVTGMGCCQNSQFFFTIEPTAQNSVRNMMDGFFCATGNSCANADISFMTDNSQQNAGSIEVQKFVCDEQNSCKDTRIWLGLGTYIQELYCNPGNCDGCTVCAAEERVVPAKGPNMADTTIIVWENTVSCTELGFSGRKFPY